MKALYLIINVMTIAFPLIRSFEPRINYAKKWRTLFPAIAITAVFFLVWDVWFTLSGVWGFNEKYITGLKIFALPLEEWMFFVTVPFASVFIYECVIYFFPKIKSGAAWRTFTIALALFLLALAYRHSDAAYTFWNFVFGSIMLMIVYYLNPAWLGKFWVAYFLHLIPFFMVNGILTGSIIEEPIVWYNNQENMGIRLITIPVEDTIYALLLLLMNITIYEGFNKRKETRT